MERPRIKVEAYNSQTGEPVDAEIIEPLSPEERETRRVERRLQRGQHAEAIRVLKATDRKIKAGKPEEAIRTLMGGFGQILMDAVVSRLKGKDQP